MKACELETDPKFCLVLTDFMSVITAEPGSLGTMNASYVLEDKSCIQRTNAYVKHYILYFPLGVSNTLSCTAHSKNKFGKTHCS